MGFVLIPGGHQTWFYNHTQGSLFIAIPANASAAALEVAGWMALFPAVGLIGLHPALLIRFAMPAALIIVFTRGQPGYRASKGWLYTQG